MLANTKFDLRTLILVHVLVRDVDSWGKISTDVADTLQTKFILVINSVMIRVQICCAVLARHQVLYECVGQSRNRVFSLHIPQWA